MDISSIFKSLFGDKQYVDVFNKIDDIIKTIPQKESFRSSDDLTGGLLEDLLTAETKKDIEKSEVDNIFKSISVPQDRLNRYQVYDEVYKSIPLIRRVIKVYISNLLQKNPVNQKCILVKPIGDVESDEEKQNRDKCEQFAKDLIEEYNLTDKLRNIIQPKKLLYGDCFVEIVNINQESLKINFNNFGSQINTSNNMVLTEITNLNTRLNNFNVNNTSNFEQLLESLSNFLVDDISLSGEPLSNLMGSGSNLQTDFNKDDISQEDLKKLIKCESFDDIILKIHDPKTIVILETKYGTRLGYLEIVENNNNLNLSGSIEQGLTQAFSKINNITSRMKLEQDKVITRLVHYILKKILKNNMKGKEKQNVEDILKSLDDGVFKIIKRMFVEQGMFDKKNITKNKVRFISPEKMAHFTIPSVENTPYGESVIEPMILPAKLYLLTQLSNIVTKTSRASLNRKWVLDIGSSQMHTGYIQKLKREALNTKTTYEDLSSIKSMPKILTDYKDIFLLARNGNRQLDVTVESMGDSSIKTADLEDYRRKIGVLIN